MTHPAILDVDRLLVDCQIETGRRSGPGGQHRNKVETAIRIRHNPSQIVAEASERRSQIDNKQQAIFRLRLLLAVQIRTDESAGSIEQIRSRWGDRIRNGKLQVAFRSQDFPALIADLLDLLTWAEFRFSTVASQLDLSTSQIVRILKLHAPAMNWINTKRSERGMPSIR